MRKKHSQELTDPKGQFLLGAVYAIGEGVPRDYKVAFMWFTKAAQQGLAEAQHNLGFMYGEGQGVTKDDKQAVYWYRKAAEQGFAIAQLNLGVLYVIGQGVPVDNVQAYKWWSLAAMQGNQTATGNRDRLRTIMSPDQIAEAGRLIQEFRQKNNKTDF
jgi:uncharacterized protein